MGAPKVEAPVVMKFCSQFNPFSRGTVQSHMALFSVVGYEKTHKETGFLEFFRLGVEVDFQLLTVFPVPNANL